MSLDFEINSSNGPAVLLLHGIPGSKATWSHVATALHPRHRVIVPDLLGFGISPPFRHDGHAAEQADALIRMLDEKGVDHVHLVGFDFGGPTAVLLLRRAPRRILSITLVATNVFTDTPVPVPLRIARVPMLGEAAFRLFFGKWGLAGMWLAATADRAVFPFSSFARVLESPMGVRSTRHIFLLSLRDLVGYYGEVEATLQAISVPAAVVWGDRDPFFPVEVGRRTAAAIPGARFELLQGCGHFVPGERATELATAIEATVALGQELAVRAKARNPIQSPARPGVPRAS